ncbi:fimbrial protein [Enterobacter sichuanensis]|uniref:fimbrial protein n=1 Tax=Enterobacter sichuanensis TaxID=2071710 RepID=UPI00217D770D|nr:fimbrial protein [Enterobacter sichuanensis]WKW90261.1 Fimbria A protein [Enterobacter sichuanensis]
MKAKKLILAVIVASGMVAGTAYAASGQGSGTVTFTGSIIDAPCSITPDTVDQTVNLGEVSKAALELAGGTSTPQNFEIKLQQCDTTTLKTVSATFTGAAATGNPNNLGITGTASGASIVLTDGAGTPVKLGTPTAAQTLADGDNILNFSAYLEADGASAVVVPGDFSSVASFTLAYQ